MEYHHSQIVPLLTDLILVLEQSASHDSVLFILLK